MTASHPPKGTPLSLDAMFLLTVMGTSVKYGGRTKGFSQAEMVYAFTPQGATDMSSHWDTYAEWPEPMKMLIDMLTDEAQTRADAAFAELTLHGLIKTDEEE